MRLKIKVIVSSLNSFGAHRSWMRLGKYLKVFRVRFLLIKVKSVPEDGGNFSDKLVRSI